MPALSRVFFNLVFCNFSILLPPPPMGCGISRYGLAEQFGACSFHPGIRRKLVELRRNDGDMTNDTLSTKLLLKEGGGETDAVDSSNDRKSISSPRKSVSSPINNAVTVKEPALERKESMKKVVGCDDAAIKKKGGEEKDKGGRKEVESKNEEAAAVERGDNEDDEGSEEDERRISDYDGSLWIGSPSFREYCIIDCDSDDGFNNDGKSDGEQKETKTKGKKCNASPKSNEGCVRQGPVTKSIKKGRKGRKIRKVFPRGRPSAMKNLLHVTSCYNPRVSSSHDKLEKSIEKTV